MSEQIKTHKSTGLEFSYFIFHTLLGMGIFFVWSSSKNLFLKTSIDQFWELFITMFFSGIIARVICYGFLWFLTKKSGGRMPGFYKLNFQKNINRISIISIVAMLLLSVVYSFGVDTLINNLFFANQDDACSMLFSYLFIKLGTQAVAWAFLKTRHA